MLAFSFRSDLQCCVAGVGTQFVSTADVLLWFASMKEVMSSRKGEMMVSAWRTFEQSEAEDDGEVKHDDSANHEGDGCPDPGL